MIGSPENNFNTMQNQQPSPQKYGNALQQYGNKRPEQSMFNSYGQFNPSRGGYNRYDNDGMQGGNPMDYNPPNFNPNGSMNPPALGVPTGQNPMNFSGPGQSISPNAPYNLQPPLPTPQTSTYNTGLAAPQTSGVQSNIINNSAPHPNSLQPLKSGMQQLAKNPFGY